MRSILISLLAVSAAATAQQPSPGEKLVKESDCSSCHAPDRQVVGPSYSEIAKRFAGEPGAADKLADRIRDGGSGNWGDVAMIPHPDLTKAQAKEMMTWIFSLKDARTAPVKAKSSGRLYTYKLKNGATRQLDFPLYVDDKAPKVTKEVFKGYALYNSYCFRCHGTDASGAELAPDLRASLVAGMKQQTFMSVAMAGKKEKGMPSWAGFLSEEDMVKVYRYVKGRSLDLIPPGRPPSETD